MQKYHFFTKKIGIKQFFSKKYSYPASIFLFFETEIRIIRREHKL